MSPDEPDGDQGRVLPLVRGATTRRTLTARRAAAFISLVTVTLTIAAGVVIWLVDKSYDSVGQGLWWAVQTLTTVGYGDVVPDSTAGKLIATIVMLNGIALLTVITAAVTATLIDQLRGGKSREEFEQQAANPAIAKALDDLGSRLDAIEASLSASRRDRG